MPAQKRSDALPARPGLQQRSLCVIGASKHIQETQPQLSGKTHVSILALEWAIPDKGIFPIRKSSPTVISKQTNKK